jgi:hypothetical protein
MINTWINDFDFFIRSKTQEITPQPHSQLIDKFTDLKARNLNSNSIFWMESACVRDWEWKTAFTYLKRLSSHYTFHQIWCLFNNDSNFWIACSSLQQQKWAQSFLSSGQQSENIQVQQYLTILRSLKFAEPIKATLSSTIITLACM